MTTRKEKIEKQYYLLKRANSFLKYYLNDILNMEEGSRPYDWRDLQALIKEISKQKPSKK